MSNQSQLPDNTSTRPVIVSIGDIVADLITVVRFPIEPGKVIMTQIPLIEPGGACNFAITAARLGTTVAMIGAPGDDTFGRMVVDVLRQENIQTDLITLLSGVPTTLVIVLADTEQFTQTYISAAVPSTGIYPFTEAVEYTLEGAGALYVQGYTLCEDYLWEVTRESTLYARKIGLPVYFDPSPLFVNAPRDRQVFALETADVIITTQDEFGLLYPGEDRETTLAKLFEESVETVVIKRGAEGCEVIKRVSEMAIPAFTVRAIGAAAAGDSFNAGFITAVLRGLPLQDAALVANAVGAVKVTRLGGGRQVPHLDEVQALLDQKAIKLDLRDWR